MQNKCDSFVPKKMLANIVKKQNKVKNKQEFVMRKIRLLILTIGLILFGCTQKKDSNNSTIKQAESATTAVTSYDKDEILKLIKQVLNWSDSENSIDLLPALTDSKDSVYVGFDSKKHEENLEKLKKTGFFSTGFIENYNQIILTLDKKLRNKEYDEWRVGYLQTFRFANDVDPWWSGQESFPLKFATIELIGLNKNEGEFYFKCGDVGHGCEGVEDYYMKFRAIKEGDNWKISYLEGFDFVESVKKDVEK